MHGGRQNKNYVVGKHSSLLTKAAIWLFQLGTIPYMRHSKNWNSSFKVYFGSLVFKAKKLEKKRLNVCMHSLPQSMILKSTK